MINNTEQIKFYKEQIGKFSNVDYTTEGYYTKTAKGKLIAVTDEGMLMIQGDFKSWTISLDKITNSSFLEYKEGGTKHD
jgi:hypothetical protein